MRAPAVAIGAPLRYHQAMAPEYDSVDPLGLLMEEWGQVTTWFWIFVAAASLCAILLPLFVVPMAAVAVGLPLTKLGHTIVIAANEIRKELAQSEPQTD